MCDFSLQSIKSRPAKIGDKLTTRDFGTGTRGFAALEDASVAVCLRPGTELSFAGGVTFSATGLLGWWHKAINHKTAIFRQINKERVSAHHDALEFPDGQISGCLLLCQKRTSRSDAPAELGRTPTVRLGVAQADADPNPVHR
jgi:hypothetical protein